MGPSFSSKNGVRYRFYISTALRGRKHKAGSVARIAAREIEGLVGKAIRKNLASAEGSDQAVSERIERVVIGKSLVSITFKSDGQAHGSSAKTLEIPWVPTKVSCTHLPPSDGTPDQKLLQAVVRAHAWLFDLQNGRFSTIEELAAAAKIHPKVARQALKLAFLAPEVTSSILRRKRSEGLTLNVLLSFAQFERELASERVKDKVAASRKKGMAAASRSAMTPRTRSSWSTQLRLKPSVPSSAVTLN